MRGLEVDAWALLEVSPDAMIAVDPDGRVIWVNAQTERLFGYRRAELVGSLLQVLLPARYQARHVEHLRAFFAAPHVRPMGPGLELFGQHADGHEVPIEISLSAIVVGERALAIAAIRDITARRQLEAELRAREQMFRGLLDAAPDATVIIDAEGRIRLINQQTTVLFGYSQAELLGAPIEVLIPERFRDRHPAHVRAFAAAPRSRTMGKCMELVARRRDGTELHVDVSLSPMAGVDGLLVMAAIRDVTERLRAAQEVVAAKLDAEHAGARLAALLEHIPDLVIVVDRDGSIEFINRVLPSFTRAQVAGTSFLSYIPQDQQDIAHRALQHVLTTRTPTHYEVVFGTGAKPVWFASAIGPTWHGDEVVGAVIIARDVSAQKRLEAQLVASERMVSMGTLAAGVAHEINNPLSAVIANLDLAMRGVVDLLDAPQDLRDELRDAHDAARRVRDIVRDLKIFSRAADDTRAPVDLRRVLESTLRLAWNEIRHRARLVKLYADVPCVEASETRLGQVFLNLIINAAQAIPEGYSGSNEIRISLRRGATDDVVVEIGDTGCGMAPEILPQLFVPFFTTKPAGLGTGLGLAICARIVGELGGKIDVESEVGKGSVFRVHLPRARSEEVPRATPPPVKIASGRGRILVIDDELVIGTVVTRILAREHDVVATTSARDAQARLSAGERFDVILCDLMMPNVTGVEFFEQLVRDFPEQAARVVFLTGGAFTPQTRAFLDDVTNLRLEKPFEVSELRALVNDRLRRGPR